MSIPTKAGWGILVAVGFLVVSVFQGCRPSHVREVASTPSAFPVRQTGILAHTALVETSGVVSSRREADLLWMVNDSGHTAALYALMVDGRDQGRIIVNGARNTDWEDLAAFDLNGRAFLLIADVGDNQAVRKTSRIYVVEEPERFSSGAFPEAVDVAWEFDFRYADGPRDCEGVAVDPIKGEILLMTKRTQPPQLYVLPLHPPGGKKVQTARRMGEIPQIPPPTMQDRMTHPRMGAFFSQPTAMDIRPDNRLAIVLTYKNAYLFPRAPESTWAAALAAQPVTVALPDLKQKEAACFGWSGRTLYITTERRPAPLLRVDLPPDI